MVDMNHLNFLEEIALNDVNEIKNKEQTYKGSWKKRGGVGCFMMLARKWDRLEGIVETVGNFGGGEHDAPAYDVFKWIEAESRIFNNDNTINTDSSVLEQVKDLRRYLLLLESEMMSRGFINSSGFIKSSTESNKK